MLAHEKLQTSKSVHAASFPDLATRRFPKTRAVVRPAVTKALGKKVKQSLSSRFPAFRAAEHR